MSDDIKMVEPGTYTPEWAEAIVSNMGCTMLHIFGYTLTSFPDVLAKTIEALAYRDPRIVTVNGEERYIGDAAIGTELQMDISDDGTGIDNLVEASEPLDLNVVSRHEFIVRGTTLNTDDDRDVVPVTVIVKVVEFITEDGEKLDLDDEDDFKYERATTVWFIVEETHE